MILILPPPSNFLLSFKVILLKIPHAASFCSQTCPDHSLPPRPARMGTARIHALQVFYHPNQRSHAGCIFGNSALIPTLSPAIVWENASWPDPELRLGLR